MLKKISFLIIVCCLFFGTPIDVKASIKYVSGESLEDLLPKIPETYSNVNYLMTEESPEDYLNYFIEERESWQPRIKYTGDSDNINEYFFCMTFHLLAPNGINYTRTNLESIPDEYYAYAYIIENGFGYRTYGDNYDDLLWDYYVTSLAIWQYQYESDLMDESKSSFVSIRDYETEDETTKNTIIALVDNAKKNTNRNKFIVPYHAADESYQDIIPYIIYEIIPPDPLPPTPTPTPTPENPKCKYKDGKYYNDKGQEVSKSEYETACSTAKIVCEYKDGKYYDTRGNEVSKSVYETDCLPAKIVCEYKDGKYYDKNGNEVNKSVYEEDCDKIEPKISISYIDNCTDGYVQNAKMKLVSGNSCSGKTIKTWTSGKLITIENITAGSYTICDTTNDYHQNITVKKIGTLQKFEMLTNDLCTEPHKDEPNSDTGVTSYLVLGGVFGLSTILYLVLRKKGIFVKIK